MQTTLIPWQRIARLRPSSARVAVSGGGSVLRFLTSILLALGIAGSVAAQGTATGSVEGRVLNVGNNRYLNNAKVTVDGTSITTYTNEFGNFRLNNVPAGDVTIRTNYTGLDETVSSVNVSPGKVAVVNVEMTSVARYGAEKAVVLDTFTVSGQREYEGDALATNEQRYAPNVKVVMSSDSFGTINEGNPGEFLKYLPGITVDYVAADVRTVSVRGFAAQFTNVYWDGIRMTSSASGSSNRIFEFEQVSINNTSRTEIIKLPTPDFPSDSLGGAVNFVSKNAFERKGAQFNYRFYFNGNNENLTAKKTPGPDSSLHYKILPNVDFDYTLPINDRFGIVITGLSSNQYVEQHRWQPTWNYAQAGATPEKPYLQQWQLQDGPKTTNRDSLAIKADWKVTDAQVLSVAVQNNYYHSFFGNRNLNFNVGTSATSTPGGGTPLVYTDTSVTSAQGRASVTQGSSYRDKYGNTLASKINWTFDNGDWFANAAGAYVKSRTWYRALGRDHFSNVGTTMQGVNKVSANKINLDTLDWQAFNAAGAALDPYDLSNYRLNTLRDDPVDGLALSKEGKGEIGRKLDLSFPLKVSAGFDIREETRDNRRYQNDYTFIGPDGIANSADDNAAAYLDVRYLNVDPFWGSKPIQWTNAYQLSRALDSNPNWFRLGTGSNQTGVQAELFRRQNSERITERVNAGFFQVDGQLLDNKLGIVAGFRYEETKDKGEGLLNDPTAVWQRNPDGTFVDGNSGAAGVQLVRKPEAGTAGSMQELNLTTVERGYKANRSYDGFYPSAHLTYNLTRDLLVRFAYAKTFGRPDYANIIPATTIDSDDTDPNNPGTLTLRNTGLKPWTAQNFEASVEYYPKVGGLVSLGAFTKSLSDFWVTKSGTVDAALASELGIDSRYVGWGVSTTVNGGDAKIEGVEFNLIRPLDFIPGWGKYFTVKLNGTKLRLTGEKATDFRGFIEETGNFNIGFNKKPFSANLTFNYRGRQKNAPQTGAQYGSTNGFYEYYAPRTFVDVSAEMKISNHLSLFAGVRNLFNKQQVLQRYNDVSPRYSQNYRFEEFAVSVSAGVKGTF
jgi:TonB-dependent receptor